MDGKYSVHDSTACSLKMQWDSLMLICPGKGSAEMTDLKKLVWVLGSRVAE